MNRGSVLFFFFSVLLGSLSFACNFSQSTSMGNPGVTVTPKSPTMLIGSTQLITATSSSQVAHNTNDTLGLSATLYDDVAPPTCSATAPGLACGSLPSSGNSLSGNPFSYTAPATVPNPFPGSGVFSTVVITATDSKLNLSGSANITITSNITVKVTPQTPSGIIPGGNSITNFTATVTNDLSANSANGVTWSLSCAGNVCGTLSSKAAFTINYTPPAAAPNPPTVILTATSVTDPNKSGSTTIPISASPVVTVTQPNGPATAGVTSATSINVLVANDAAGDVLTPTLSGTAGGTACTNANGLCGVFGPAVTFNGIANGTGSYTIPFTPPAHIPSTTTVTLMAASSLANSAPGSNTITVNPPAVVTVTSPGALVSGSAFAGIRVSVANDVPGDVLTPTLSGMVNGTACTNANGLCGTVAPVTGTSGSGLYNINYTPPVSLPSATSVTLAVSSNLPVSTSGSATFTVNPGPPFIFIQQPTLSVTAGTTGQSTFNIGVNNDVAGDSITAALSTSGSACAPTCGAITSPAAGTSGGGAYTVIYTPPASPSFSGTVVLTISSSVAGSNKPTSQIIVTAAVSVVTITQTTATVTAGSATPATFNITVTNDQAGDAISAALSISGGTCSNVTNNCGSLGATIGTSGSGAYTVAYTPPTTVPSPALVTLTASATKANSSQGTSAITINASGPPPPPATVLRFLFGATTAPNGASAIAQFTVNAASGQLRTNGYTPLNDGALAASDAIVIDPTYSYLYALTSGTVSGGGGDLHAFSIGSTSGTSNSGALTPIATYASIGTAAPAQVIMDPQGKYVYVVTTSTSKIEGFTVSNGVLTPMAAPFATKDEPSFIVIDPTDKYLYSVSFNAGAVEMFTITQGTGALSELPESAVITGNQPVWMGIDPTGKFAYVVNQSDQTISQFTILQSNGTCSGGATPVFAGTLCPNGRVGPEVSGSIAAAIAPSGLYFYTADEADTITSYSITPGTGVLGAPILNPTASVPKSIFFDPTGANLYYGVAPSGSGGVLGSVGAFQVNAITGVLTAATTIAPPTDGTASSLAGTAGPAVAYTPTLAFTSNINFPDNAASFTITSGSGLLTFQNLTLDGSDPQNMAADPLGRYLYVSDLSGNNITAFSINSTNAALTGINGSPFATGTSPQGIVVDPSGQFVYAVNFTNPGTISPYAIAPNSACMGSPAAGALCSLGSPTAAGNEPSAVVADTSGAFLYVTEIGNSGILVYSIGPAGVLTSVATTSLPANLLPLAIAMDPFSRFLYVLEQQSNTIGIFSIAGNGKLTSVGSMVTNSTNIVNLAVDPLGRYLYATNDVQNSVLAYSIQQTGAQAGTLTAVAGSPFSSPTNGGSMYGLAVDPSAQYLYVSDAKTASSDMIVFSINQSTGVLTYVTGSVISTQGNSPNPVVILGAIH